MMTRDLRIRHAIEDDSDAIIWLIDEASDWLSLKGTDQWARPWPNRKARDERVHRGLCAGRTWIVEDPDGVVATVTCRRNGDRQLWSDREQAEPALYMSRLIVSRRAAGEEIGSQLIDWVGHRAFHEWTANWIRIDVWTTNHALHAYYINRGFTLSRFYHDPDYPSGALFQKATSDIISSKIFYPEITSRVMTSRQTDPDREHWSSRQAEPAL